MGDLEYMKLAQQLALKGKGTTSPNPMVGAVVVQKGRIIGRGGHRRCGGPHAEGLALRQAGRRAQGATLYVTLEPCFHFGRTPPCVDAVIKAGIRNVVVGVGDPNPLTAGKSIRKLRRHGIRVRVGVLQKELSQMNEVFEKYITKRIPFVVAKIAQTLDGKVATESGQSRWITSQETRVFSRRLRNDFDAVLVGSKTLLKDDPWLTADKTKKHLKKIVLDSRLRMGLHARIFRERPEDCLIATTRKANSRKISRFKRKGASVIICPSRRGRVDLRWLLRDLARREITSVLIEGGPTVIGEALRRRLVDKFHIFIAPKILADEKGKSAVCGLRCANVNKSFKLKDLRVQNIGSDLFVEAYPLYS